MKSLVVLAAVVGVLGAAAETAGSESSATTATPGLYRGTTSQGYRLNFRVLPGGRAISPFAATIRVRCNGADVERVFLPPGRAAFNGVSFTRRASDGKGGVYLYGGTFAGATARGSISLGSTRILVNSFEVCVTVGTVRWTARRIGP